MSGQQFHPAFWHRHPFVASFAVLGEWWLLQNGWYLTAAVPAAVVLYISLRRRHRYAQRRRSGLAARAEYENQLVLAGDLRGVHGRFPPARAGWFTDPANGARLRYFDGAAWSPYTAYH